VAAVVAVELVHQLAAQVVQEAGVMAEETGLQRLVKEEQIQAAAVVAVIQIITERLVALVL
jgi:hypothetical protein